jgi:excisionase family DNA binding protein
VVEIAQLFKLNPQTVRNWIERGELPCVRVGTPVRIRWEDLEKFMEPRIADATTAAAPAANAPDRLTQAIQPRLLTSVPLACDTRPRPRAARRFYSPLQI